MPRKTTGRRRATAKRPAKSNRSRGFISLFSGLGKTTKGKSLLSSLNPSRIQATLVVALVAVVGTYAVYASFATTKVTTSTLFAATAKPKVIDTSTAATELGLKFVPTVKGNVTAVRFYKAAGNTGTHTGHLWNNDGKLLASVTFSKETASGWQSATFAKPIAVTAGTQYVISYHTNAGHYANDPKYFTKSLTRGSLRAPANSPQNINGVFVRGGTAFPTKNSLGANYWVDVALQTTATASPTPTRQPLSAAPTTSAADLTDARKKDIAMQLVSSAENSSLNWKAQYSYIEDIGDGRGYTGGIIGFCSGCGDMANVVAYYNTLVPNNGLAKYLTTLRGLGNSESASHTGLGDAFVVAWKAAAKDPKFQEAQDHERDRVYFNPSVSQAKTDGLHALGQFIYYDAMVMHGPGSDAASFGGIRAAALKKAKTPAQGSDETTYLHAFLDARKAAMLSEAAHSETSRVDTEQRVFLNAGNLNLNPPLSWKTYGDSYTIAK